MKKDEIKYERGMSESELYNVEKIYEIKFPLSLKEYLMKSLPISKGFYNWRDCTDENINYIKKIMNRPLMDLYESIEDIFWSDNWGTIVEDEKKVDLIKEKIKSAPKLIPVFSHRYMPMIDEDNPPIISVSDIDVIYYGENLCDYLDIEFGNKLQNEIDFEKISYIRFWSDIM